jgi:hypothetical protein
LCLQDSQNCFIVFTIGRLHFQLTTICSQLAALLFSKLADLCWPLALALACGAWQTVCSSRTPLKTYNS